MANDVMIVDTMLSPGFLSSYYVLPPHEGKKWQRAKGLVKLVGKDITGVETSFKKEFKPKSIIGLTTPEKKAVAIYEVEEIVSDTLMKVKKLNNVDVPNNHLLRHHYQKKSTYQAIKQKYPIVISGLEFLTVQNEIAWLRNLKLTPRMKIEVRVQIAGFPSESFGAYFRLLLSPTDSVTDDTVEFSYDSSKGYLLRQIVLPQSERRGKRIGSASPKGNCCMGKSSKSSYMTVLPLSYYRLVAYSMEPATSRQHRGFHTNQRAKVKLLRNRQIHQRPLLFVYQIRRTGYYKKVIASLTK
eukprot:TRINITY_DN7206_c0_g1_i1.p1 TRINITY_DN7206_c0_g1~~TRINITY_DN7206_c0_g1_i1.p1  ORF type:complete len:298 (+),score=0.39 TRINITY_DN7206_c0_g1_i1:1108-2001(+)